MRWRTAICVCVCIGEAVPWSHCEEVIEMEIVYILLVLDLPRRVDASE